MGSPVSEALVAVVDILERRHAPYMVMGGFAVRVWGIPRPTFDVDITLSADEHELSRFYDEVEREGFTVPEPFRSGFVDSLRGLSKVKLILFGQPSPIDIDLFLAGTKYQKEALSRRQRLELEGRQMWIVGPEDLVLHKLIAGRLRDLSDIEDILLVHGPMDVAYLRQWGDELGVRESLERSLRSAGYP